MIRAALDFYLAQRLPCSAKGKNYLYIYYLLSSSRGIGYIAVLKWIRSQRLKEVFMQFIQLMSGRARPSTQVVGCLLSAIVLYCLLI